MTNLRSAGTVLFFRPRKKGTVPFSLATFLFLLFSSLHAAPPDFSDDFESHSPNAAPGAPWTEETYDTGAIIRIDETRAFTGSRALHITTPRGANYRRGYVAIHLGGPLPQLQSGFFGRAMVWLDAAPQSTPGAPPVHWTLLQGEGRSGDGRYNSIYRLGLEEGGGRRFMANFETTPPATTDCRQRTLRRIPLRQWACVEWRFSVARNALEFWIDGARITRVTDRARSTFACRGDDLDGQWLAPPKFASFYLGFERYADSVNDQDLWIDDVVLSKKRVGCPARGK
jgi:hypothetical protein